MHYGGRFTSPLIVDNVIRFAEPVNDLNPVHLDIEGIPGGERSSFLNDMHARLRDERVCYRHQWQDGDILIADNLTLLHGRNAFAANTERLIRRVNVC